MHDPLTHTNPYHTTQTAREEQHWLLRLAQGDEAAFTELYLRYQPDLLRLLAPFRDQVDPMEIVQDIFYKIWLKRASMVAVQSIRGYLYRMVRNRLLDLRKARAIEQRHTQRYSANEPAATTSLELQLEYQELHQEAKRAISGLPARQRDILLASIWQDMGREQIAATMNLSLSVVDKELWRANKAVRAAIEAHARRQ